MEMAERSLGINSAGDECEPAIAGAGEFCDAQSFALAFVRIRENVSHMECVKDSQNKEDRADDNQEDLDAPADGGKRGVGIEHRPQADRRKHQAAGEKDGDDRPAKGKVGEHPSLGRLPRNARRERGCIRRGRDRLIIFDDFGKRPRRLFFFDARRRGRSLGTPLGPGGAYSGGALI